MSCVLDFLFSPTEKKSARRDIKKCPGNGYKLQGNAVKTLDNPGIFLVIMLGQAENANFDKKNHTPIKSPTVYWSLQYALPQWLCESS